MNFIVISTTMPIKYDAASGYQYTWIILVLSSLRIFLLALVLSDWIFSMHTIPSAYLRFCILCRNPMQQCVSMKQCCNDLLRDKSQHTSQQATSLLMAWCCNFCINELAWARGEEATACITSLHSINTWIFFSLYTLWIRIVGVNTLDKILIFQYG